MKIILTFPHILIRLIGLRVDFQKMYIYINAYIYNVIKLYIIYINIYALVIC